MATKLRPIDHDDRLSLVEHLDELRSRLIWCAVAIVASFSFCFWQNDAILDIVNEPLEKTQNVDGSERTNDPLEQSARFQIRLGEALAATAPALRSTRDAIAELAQSERLTARERTALTRPLRQLDAAVAEITRAAAAVPENRGRQPVTLGPAEPFTTTINVALYASILLVLPFLLFQAYAFVLPAFTSSERKLALPLMLMVPFLFIGGSVFGYFVVLPRGIDFLQNFNDDDFDILIQAKEYYRFAIMLIGGMGLLFEIPVAVLAATRVGGVTIKQLRSARGYVILAIAVLAAVATPTPDPITMTLAMGPLVVLYELSILLAAWINRIRPPEARWEDTVEDHDDADLDPFADDDPEHNPDAL